jgi:hypothetical protein
LITQPRGQVVGWGPGVGTPTSDFSQESALLEIAQVGPGGLQDDLVAGRVTGDGVLGHGMAAGMSQQRDLAAVEGPGPPAGQTRPHLRMREMEMNSVSQ